MDAAVVEVLRQAVSQDPVVLKSAEQTLKQWETQEGFYIALYVSCDRTEGSLRAIHCESTT